MRNLKLFNPPPEIPGLKPGDERGFVQKGREPRPSGRGGSTLFLWFCLLNMLGCAARTAIKPAKPEGIPGIYHRLERGQTLWKISKIYNLGLDELVKINRIPDAANIEAGQLIFIPGRNKTQSFSNEPSEDFIWPAKGRVILGFGQTYNNTLNKGINIQTRNGSDVVASRSGRVAFYNPNFGSFRNTLIIDHGDGFITVYARNSEVFVKAGDLVQRGTLIARISSSSNSLRDKNTYLHFEIRKGYISQNPYFYLPR